MSTVDLRLLGQTHVDLSALPRHRYWSLSSDGEVGFWTQLDAERDPTGPYGDVQHAVDELAERARTPVPFPREYRGPEANDRGLQAALRLAVAALVLTVITLIARWMIG